MDHHHRHVAVTALRHHVAHVHLVDGDVPTGAEVAQFRLRLIDLVAADEEAALGLQHQRRVRGLHILEGLRRHVPRNAENGTNGYSREDGRSAQHPESLTVHVKISSRDSHFATCSTFNSFCPRTSSLPSTSASGAQLSPAARITALASGLNPAGFGSTR